MTEKEEEIHNLKMLRNCLINAQGFAEKTDVYFDDIQSLVDRVDTAVLNIENKG